MEINSFITNTVGLIALFTPIILAIVQIAKSWISNERWYPIVAIATGVVLAYLFSGIPSATWSILLGVLAGLSASGLYSGTRAVTGK